MKEPFAKFIENELGDGKGRICMKNYQGLLRFARNDEVKSSNLFQLDLATFSRHCEAQSAEAISRTGERKQAGDCFALLAMTGQI